MPDSVEIIGDTATGVQEPGGSGSSASDAKSTDDTGVKLLKDFGKASLSFADTEGNKLLSDKPGSSIGTEKTKNKSSQKNHDGSFGTIEKVGIVAAGVAVIGGIAYGVFHRTHKKHRK